MKAQDFWGHVRVTDDCWYWMGNLNPYMYGQASVRGLGSANAHRLAYILHYGELPEPGMHVCHICDNPQCVRPDHLELKTHKENQQDKKRGKSREDRVLYKLNPGYKWAIKTVRFWFDQKRYICCVMRDGEDVSLCGQHIGNGNDEYTLRAISMRDAGDGKHYGIYQKSVCYRCFSKLNHLDPNGYYAIRKIPERMTR